MSNAAPEQDDPGSELVPTYDGIPEVDEISDVEATEPLADPHEGEH